MAIISAILQAITGPGNIPWAIVSLQNVWLSF